MAFLSCLCQDKEISSAYTAGLEKKPVCQKFFNIDYHLINCESIFLQKHLFLKQKSTPDVTLCLSGFTRIHWEIPKLKKGKESAHMIDELMRI